MEENYKEYKAEIDETALKVATADKVHKIVERLYKGKDLTCDEIYELMSKALKSLAFLVKSEAASGDIDSAIQLHLAAKMLISAGARKYVEAKRKEKGNDENDGTEID